MGKCLGGDKIPQGGGNFLPKKRGRKGKNRVFLNPFGFLNPLKKPGAPGSRAPGVSGTGAPGIIGLRPGVMPHGSDVH